MRIVVCVKQVPDVESERRFTGTRLERGDDMVTSEIDFNAVEAAVSLVEDHGGQVVALSMGPHSAEDTVRRAIQVGADAAVLVSDPALQGSDVPATARVLAAAIRRLDQEEPVDLVVTAMASLDGQTSMVPAALAAALGWPGLTMADRYEFADGRLQVERVLDDAVEQLSAPLPAVLAVTDEANEARMAGFRGIMAAKKATVEHWSVEDIGVDPATVGEAGAASTVRSATELPGRGPGLRITDTGEAGVQLARFLVEGKFVEGAR